MEKIKEFFLKNSSTKQIVIKNTFWLFIGEAGGRILKLFLIIYAARILGAGGWGIFAYALSVASLLMIFSDIGIGTLITREVSKNKDSQKTFITATLLLKSIILLVSVLLVIFVAPHISNIEEAKILFPLIGVILLFDSIREIGFSINRALEKMEKEMIIKVIMNAVILVFGVALIKANPIPVSLAKAYAVGSITGAILIGVLLRKNIAQLITKTNIEMLKLVMKTVLPFAIIALVGSIMGNTDIFMLGLWKTPEDIGIYSAAQRLFQFMLIIPSMIATATLPLMSRLANQDNEKFKTVLEKTFSIIMVIGLPIAFGGFILANQIIPLAFGMQYVGAIPVFQILMIMLLASFPLLLLTSSVFVYNEQKKLVLANVFGVLSNVLLNFWLIPILGVMGAAIATLTSTIIVTYVIWRKMKKINNFEILPKLKRIILPIIVMVLFVLIFRNLKLNVILNILFSALAYIGILIKLNKSILQELKEITSKNNGAELQ